MKYMLITASSPDLGWEVESERIPCIGEQIGVIEDGTINREIVRVDNVRSIVSIDKDFVGATSHIFCVYAH